MTDFRALCAQLADDLQEARDAVSDWAGYASAYFQEKHNVEKELCRIQRQIDRARAALAEPMPKPPTDEELYGYWISTSPEFGCADPVGFARAVLERWGDD